MSRPPFCHEDCCCHDFARRIEEQDRIIADLVRQRDALQLAQKTLLAVEGQNAHS